MLIPIIFLFTVCPFKGNEKVTAISFHLNQMTQQKSFIFIVAAKKIAINSITTKLRWTQHSNYLRVVVTIAAKKQQHLLSKCMDYRN